MERHLCHYISTEIEEHWDMTDVDEHIEYNSENNKYKCGLCYKEFTRKDSLQNHFENFHIKFSGYPCDYCGQIFKSKNNRRVHFHKHHYEEHKMARQAAKSGS